MRERAFSLLEVTIGGAILVMVFGVAASALVRDQHTHRVLTAQLGPELTAQDALERIATELRMAGEWAEDRDHDGQLDPGEDGNGNGILDAAWDLPDGAIGQDRLSFNRRIDIRGVDGSVVACGVYSRRVTYRVQGTDLVREWECAGAGGTVEIRGAVVAHDIGALRFSRSGVVVTVAMDVLLPQDVYEPGRRTLTARVWLRN